MPLSISPRLLSLGLLVSLAPPVRAASPQTHKPRQQATPAAPSQRLTPLSPHEAAQQLLNRFTYGARPGEVDRVLAQTPAAWLEQQLHPASIPDPVLAKRLADYPTLTLSPAQVLGLFPDAALLRQIENGKAVMPSDPRLVAVYQVQLLKYDRREARKAAAGTAAAPSTAGTPAPSAPGQPAPVASMAPPPGGEAAQPTFEDAPVESRREWRETASRLAAQLTAKPATQRIPALLQLPTEQRAIVATFTVGDDRAALLRDVSPEDRELFLAMAGGPNVGRVGEELAEATILRDILSERQLEAVMTDFWFNHFNIFLGKEADRWYTPTYVRDTIRPHALGHFHDLLLATAQSPAMLVYLDNWLSVGPNSPEGAKPARNLKGKKGAKGLNENYGRELMELHTLSVDGGYSQADVTALAAIFTGWTVDRPRQGGGFQFDQRRHEPGDKQWLGRTIHEGHNLDGSPNGMREGLEALDILARSPRTARFISTLLAQRFVADTPPPALVDRLTAVYLSTDGDISAMLQSLAASPEFNSRQFFRSKVKTPVEFVASAFRTTGTDPSRPTSLVGTLRQMGMPLFGAQPPTGYYLTADHWMNSAALVDRLAFADNLTAGRLGGQQFDADRLLASSLLSLGSTGVAPPSALPMQPGDTPAKLRRTSAETLPSRTGSSFSSASSTGLQVATQVVALQVLGGLPTAATEHLLETELSQPWPTASDALIKLDRILLSSPDFQRK